MKINIKKILWKEINSPAWVMLIVCSPVVISILIASSLDLLSSQPIVTTKGPISVSIPVNQLSSLLQEEQEQTEENYVDCSCEETFEEPIDVVWAGNVFAHMQSGEAFGITRGFSDDAFFACCIEGKMIDDKWTIEDIEGKVRVTGKWTGITCAYGNTIFGRCVPNVEIERIEKIKEYTPVTHINDLKWFTAKIEEDNKYAGIDIEYPQFIGGEEVEKLNEYIKETVLNVLRADRDQVKEWIINKEEECERDTYNGTLTSCRVQLFSEYRVASIINDIVSLELVLTDFTGGGNGNHSRSYGINWDLKNNRLLDNKDLFCYKEYPNELASIVYENLNKYNAPIDKKYLPYITEYELDETIQSSEFEVLLGYQGLSIVFQPYVILSGSAGFVRAPIPYYDLEGKICF